MISWLDLCRNRACISCGQNDGTVVPAHRNEGKGMGVKTDDFYAIPLCYKCHFWYDNGPAPLEHKRAYWKDHWLLHMSALLAAGMVAPVGYSEKVRPFKRLAKILPRDPGPRAA